MLGLENTAVSHHTRNVFHPNPIAQGDGGGKCMPSHIPGELFADFAQQGKFFQV